MNRAFKEIEDKITNTTPAYDIGRLIEPNFRFEDDKIRRKIGRNIKMAINDVYLVVFRGSGNLTLSLHLEKLATLATFSGCGL